jgi:hypothetical protein
LHLPGTLPPVATGAKKLGNGQLRDAAPRILPDTPPNRKEEIRRQLDAYCRLDTFAMVRLWHFFSSRRGAAPVDAG